MSDSRYGDAGGLPRTQSSRGGARAGRRLMAWLAPDLALTFALTTLLSLFFVFNGATTLFNDSDTGWHIRNGERIISTRSLPHADPFSFSKPGEPWVAWEWGADVLMGAVYRVSGLGGVALLFGLCIGAAVWMWFRLNGAAGGNCLLAGLFFIPMLPTTTLHWLARPHLLSWLFLLGTVWLCERMPHRLGWRHLTLVAIAAAAWANLHASFFFAPLIVLIYAAGAYLKPMIWDVQRALDPGNPRRQCAELSLACSRGSGGYAREPERLAAAPTCPLLSFRFPAAGSDHRVSVLQFSFGGSAPGHAHGGDMFRRRFRGAGGAQTRALPAIDAADGHSAALRARPAGGRIASAAACQWVDYRGSSPRRQSDAGLAPQTR